MIDVVYYFQGDDSEELRYSIRSVEKNIDFNRIFLVGDKPSWFKETSRSIYVESKNINLQKYGLGSVPILHLKKLLNSGKMPDNFLLFNDDFFILQKVDKWIDYYRNEKDYKKKALNNLPYHRKTIRSLKYTKEQKKYNLHIPITINKKNFIELYNMWIKFDNYDIDFRTLYGNLYINSDKSLDDVKICSCQQCEEFIKNNKLNTFVSTSNVSFNFDKVGFIIRDIFDKPSFVEML